MTHAQHPLVVRKYTEAFSLSLALSPCQDYLGDNPFVYSALKQAF